MCAHELDAALLSDEKEPHMNVLGNMYENGGGIRLRHNLSAIKRTSQDPPPERTGDDINVQYQYIIYMLN